MIYVVNMILWLTRFFWYDPPKISGKLLWVHFGQRLIRQISKSKNYAWMSIFSSHSVFWVCLALLRRPHCENDSILFKFFTALMFHLFSSCLKCLYRQVLIPNKPFHLSSSFHLVFCVMARQRALADRLGWLTLIRAELSSYQRENCINNITSLRI